MTDWWKTFFQPSVYPLADLVDGDETQREVRELLRRLPIPRRARILDVACGVGRHSLLLAKKGYRVTGVDYSAGYISHAKNKAAKSKIDAQFMRRDMRKLGFDGKFDVVLNLFTSFGYFKNPSDDSKALKSMYRSLKPGGFFAIDIVDGDSVRRHFKPKDWYASEKGWELNESRLIDGADPSSRTRWTFIKRGGKVSHGESFVRLYDRARLKKTLSRVGFTGIKISGGLLEKNAPGSEFTRIMAVAQRPK